MARPVCISTTLAPRYSGRGLGYTLMKAICALLISLFTVGIAITAESGAAVHKYDFIITDSRGRTLGKGSITLPFTFGSDGKGTATWEFKATVAKTKDKYWAKAKGHLETEGGKAEAECKDSWFTLNFDPHVQDNNAMVHWDIKKEPTGTLYYCDVAGGHRCALFRIVQKDAQRGGAVNRSQPIRSETNRTSEAAGSRR